MPINYMCENLADDTQCIPNDSQVHSSVHLVTHLPWELTVTRMVSGYIRWFYYNVDTACFSVSHPVVSDSGLFDTLDCGIASCST